MSFFSPLAQGSRLYVAASGAGDAGWLAYLLPSGSALPDGIDLAPALAQLPGSFLFSATAPDLSVQPRVDALISGVDTVIAVSPASRGFLWLKDPASVTPATTPLMGIGTGGTSVSAGLAAPVVETLFVNVGAGMQLALDGETLSLSGAGKINYSGASAPSATQATQVPSGSIPLTGAWRGCIQFSVDLQRQFLHDGWEWGFQFQAPHDDPVRTALGERLPLAAGNLPSAGDLLGFAVSFDPSDPLNRRAAVADRSVLVFTGTNQDGTRTVLASCYATPFGAPVTLVPLPGPAAQEPNAARFLFNPGAPDDRGNHDLQLAPEGDFTLVVDGATENSVHDLICGLQGTEYLSFQPAVEGGYEGDRMRFVARRPAYAPRYPFTQVSPVGPPVDLQAPLLDGTYTTSWGTVVRAPGAGGANAYVAQPKGASLYGRDALIHPQGANTLFGALDPSVVLPTGVDFPLVPYAGSTPGNGVTSFTAGQMADFERQVVGPTRRRVIDGQSPAPAPSKTHILTPDAAPAASPYTTTTPTGLLVSVGADGRWSKILLAQNLSPTLRQMCFCAPDDDLQQAFQTSDLLLVVANATHLGAFSGDGSGQCGAAAAFQNRMNVGDWVFAADVGQANQYDDYTDVMIVKGRRGALWDPTSDETRRGSLVANPDQWTQKEAFASPSDLATNPNAPPDQIVGAPNPAELTALSYWLQQYFDDATTQLETDYFARFNAIARNPAWTGILFLRMRIASIPTDLVGIVAGVTAPERFNAHHLGIEISQVANDPSAADIELSNSSSLFGLIYYEDPELVRPAAGADPQPVPPAAGETYNFRVLSLKALFENTAVQRFQSYAQLTLGRLFDMPVDHMGTGGNPYATLVLRGSYQDNAGQAVYSLGTASTSTFYFGNSLFNKIEVDGAQMSTRDSGGTSGNVESWFALNGFLDFAVVQAGAGGDFDIFSFGNEAGQDLPRRGLSYSNLGLRMSFPTSNPSQVSMEFVTGEIRFDVATSTPRAGSLFVNFALGLQGLVTGTAGTGPEADGYLTVVTDATLTGVDGGSWYGLAYQLDMGTPGKLAGSAGLTSALLTAWAPENPDPSRYRALLGIQLPGTGGGAKLISLQNVLRLSIGQIRLTYDREQSSFLLMLTEIALKFMGLLKIPPSGSTLFYLFGNPRSQGKPSGLGWYAMYRQAG